MSRYFIAFVLIAAACKAKNTSGVQSSDDPMPHLPSWTESQLQEFRNNCFASARQKSSSAKHQELFDACRCYSDVVSTTWPYDYVKANESAVNEELEKTGAVQSCLEKAKEINQ